MFTDRNSAIRQIEVRLGSEGSWGIAAEMLDIMEDEWLVMFDQVFGYVGQDAEIDEYKWLAMWERAEERLI